jgi:hypothetical protein
MSSHACACIFPFLSFADMTINQKDLKHIAKVVAELEGMLSSEDIEKLKGIIVHVQKKGDSNFEEFSVWDLVVQLYKCYEKTTKKKQKGWVRKVTFDFILKYTEAPMKLSPKNDGVPLTWDELEKGIIKESVMATAVKPDKIACVGKHLVQFSNC